MRRILHVDMDAFYASVEQHDRSELAGRPVIVGADPKKGSGRGVVAACSYEARRFGVHSAQPIREAWRRCPDGVYVRPRMERYREVSDEIMAIFQNYTDAVEPLSIDEAFLDVTGSTRLLGSGEEIAKEIRTAIRNQTGLTASVGVAPNKFLAKVASDLGKPDGLIVVADDTVGAFLAPLPIRSLWGVGPRTAARLQDLGIRTIGQLAARPQGEIVAQLGAHAAHLWDLAHGRDERPVVPRAEPKSISNETTFGEDVEDETQLLVTLRRLADQVARRMRGQGYRARTITLKLRFSSFTTYTRRATGTSVDTGDDIFAVVRRLFRQFDRPEPVRLLGVGASGLVRELEDSAQMPLFDIGIKTGQIDRAVDQVLRRYGDASIRRASDLP